MDESRDLDEFIGSHLLSDEAAAHLRALAKGWGERSRASERAEVGRLNMVFDEDTGSLEPVDIQRPVTLESIEDATPRGDVFTREGARYELMGLLGRGGMGEVWRVRDRDLNRTLAMKIVRWELAQNDRIVARFVEEAQTCAQLQHPGIVPVFEIGRLPDSRLYFTMEEIRGQNLRDLIDELHEQSAALGHWVEPGAKWTLRGLVRAFARACSAVAFAHARGVIHRDLKPANIMIGDDGSVLVVDWGISKIVGRPDLAADIGELEPVVTKRATSGEVLTRPGAITGTPNYMAPEQVMGEVGDVQVKADVYALGGVLYKLLTGAPPYGYTNPMAIFLRISKGAPASPIEQTDLPLPSGLVAICQKAMSHDVSGRYADAGELAEALYGWLEGVQRRERALEVVAEARELDASASELRAQARALQAQAARALQTVPPFAGEEAKYEGWRLGDEAIERRREASLVALETEQRLESALRIAPDLSEAIEALAMHHRELHELDEADADADAAATHEAKLRTHLASLSAANPMRRSHERYLEGTGALSLEADAPGARATISRYERVHRRLIAGEPIDLGEAPVRDHALAPGSYVVELSAPGKHTTRYPVHIERQRTWDTTRPGEQAAAKVRLPDEGELGENEVFVPAGWFVAGGEPTTAGGFDSRRYWCDDFAVQRFPVTNAEFLVFLNELIDSDQEEVALQIAPRERAAGAGEQGSMLYERDGDGRFTLHADAARRGRAVDPDWPATNIDWHGAYAYAQWFAERTGQPWRLPTEWEWEKAARGVDGRAFPWGQTHDPSWSCMQDSRPGQPHADVIDSFPIDVSPYGVRGVAGNVTTWCLNPFSLDAPEGDLLVAPEGAPGADDPTIPRVGRGGAWFFPPKFCQSAWRFRFIATYRYGFLGIRLLRPL